MHNETKQIKPINTRNKKKNTERQAVKERRRRRKHNLDIYKYYLDIQLRYTRD